ncbi:hypothetical protein BDQ17DRAFT_1425098 [Cyathus striatus]|nr:hypothetical protein BDQ17DRAFT_1425098 [Cyathus striatus]
MHKEPSDSENWDDDFDFDPLLHEFDNIDEKAGVEGRGERRGSTGSWEDRPSMDSAPSTINEDWDGGGDTAAYPIPILRRLTGMLRDISPALSFAPTTTEEEEGRMSMDFEQSIQHLLTLPNNVTPTNRMRSNILPMLRRLFPPKLGRLGSPLHTLSISPPTPPPQREQKAVLHESEVRDSLEDIPLLRLGGRRKWILTFTQIERVCSD